MIPGRPVKLLEMVSVLRGVNLGNEARVDSSKVASNCLLRKELHLSDFGPFPG